MRWASFVHEKAMLSPFCLQLLVSLRLFLPPCQVVETGALRRSHRQLGAEPRMASSIELPTWDALDSAAPQRRDGLLLYPYLCRRGMPAGCALCGCSPFHSVRCQTLGACLVVAGRHRRRRCI